MRPNRKRNRSRVGWLMLTSRPFEQQPQKNDTPRFSDGEREACSKKRRYTDEPSARAMAACQAKFRNDGKLYVYRCKVCNGWHLTKRPNGTPATAADPFAVQNAA